MRIHRNGGLDIVGHGIGLHILIPRSIHESSSAHHLTSVGIVALSPMNSWARQSQCMFCCAGEGLPYIAGIPTATEAEAM